jgi:Fur family peroxide stress response transcriptional regulator
MQSIDKHLDLLRAAGMRATPQRIAICRQILDTDSHPSANQIYKNLKDDYPSLSLMTVYNTLKALVNLGAIKELGNVGDDSIHYDGNTDPHINFTCISCHKIIDLFEQGCTPEQLEAMIPNGYTILGSSLLIHGLCPNCQPKE